ncbi:uridylate kinase [Tundrisphaera sp. TA3]|uniref:amino acid kinase family protein n=1 Tax=Tundrisphaera sp. TA3 TaxID=3435775 RepID=UPI003EBE7843
MVVIKVGGSLLDWPGLPARLAAEVAGREAVLLAGGGRFADALRDLDRVHGLGERRSHALALRVLDLTAKILADLVPGSEVVDDPDAISDARRRGRVPVLAPRRFLDADDARPDALPHAWTTTTDAIAARVAVRLGADELVLLKSAGLQDGVGLEDAARLGLVDPEFPRAADGLPLIRLVNARDPGGTPRTFAGRVRGPAS